MFLLLYFKAEEIIRVEVTKKLHKVCSSRALEEVLVAQSELQIGLVLLAINICEIKGNLTESKLGCLCVSLLK